MSNPFTRQGKEPNYTTENFSVRDVKRANARFYEKFPEAIEPAAMIKKAMQIDKSYPGVKNKLKEINRKRLKGMES